MPNEQSLASLAQIPTSVSGTPQSPSHSTLKTHNPQSISYPMDDYVIPMGSAILYLDISQLSILIKVITTPTPTQCKLLIHLT